MPRRALIDRRPWLLASLFFGMSWWFVAGSAMPGLHQIAWKGAAVGLLAVYAAQRHLGRDGTMMAAVMALSAAGDMALELYDLAAALLFAMAHGVAIALYARHRRPRLTPSQKACAITLLIGTPLIAYLLLVGSAERVAATGYALLLGAMAAMAWSSRFSRYRVGAGAVLFVASHLLLLAAAGTPLSAAPGAPVVGRLVWPLYYTGQLLICTGVIAQLLRERRAGRVLHGGDPRSA